MSNYTSLARNEVPGPYASNHSISSHRVLGNVVGGGQFSQRYYQSSSSLASALTPVVSKAEEKKAQMWPQPSSYKTGLQAHLSGLPLNNQGWYDEHRMHGQTISRSVSVVPERHKNSWNSVNGLQSGYQSNHSPFDHNAGPRRAFTPAPQDINQLPQQQRQVPIGKLSDSVYAKPGFPSHTSPSALNSSLTSHQSPFSCYYTDSSLERLHSKETTNNNASFSTTPTYLASSGYSTAERFTSDAGQLSLSPEFLYVNVDGPEDEPTIHCPYQWCKSTFTRSNDLTRHLATASMHREPVGVDPSKRCRLCGEEFSRSDARNRHEIKRSCGRKRTRRAAAV